MNKRAPVPGYRLLSSPSMKLKLKDDHYETPCICYILHATCYILNATCYIQHYSTTNYMLHNTKPVRDATCYMLRATCYLLHTI